MSLRDEIASEAKIQREGKIATVVAELGKEGKELLEILADPAISSSAIKRVLKKRGYEVSHATICRYRENLK